METNGNEATLRFCNNFSILVINPNGKLKQVFTPFKVIANNNAIIRQVFIVDEVRSTGRDELVYIINGKPFYHHHFYIDIHF